MPEAGLLRLAPWFTGGLFVLVPALLFVLVRGQRLRATVGEVLASERSRRARIVRAVVPGGLLVVLFVWCATGPEARFEVMYGGFEALAVVVLLAWFSPARADRVVGRDGVQVGWRARTWGGVQGARLEGAVLEFEFEGRRERVELSPALLIAAREVLGTQVCARTAESQRGL